MAFSEVSLLKSWLKADYGDPAQRFIYVDGAPFDGGPDATRPVVRAFRTPMVKMAIVATVFCSAAIALVLPPKLREAALALAFTAPLGFTLLNRDLCRNRYTFHPSLKNVLIDKTGRSFNDAKALSDAKAYYRSEIRFGLTGIIGITPAGAGLVYKIAMFAGHTIDPAVSRVLGLPSTPVESQPVAAAVAMMAVGLGVPYFGSALSWALHARHQLHREEKPWTVTGDPPPVRRQVTEPAEPYRLPGLVPVRVGALSRPGGR